jgi:tetratricopeptide (TPR) repeat protein
VTTIPEALAIAFAQHERGNLPAAERIYRQIVDAEPTHAEAWHLLGVAAHQAGRHAEAIASIGQALALAGPNAAYLNHLGAAHGALQNLDQAEAAFRQALELAPADSQTHYNLAALLNLQGQSEAAIASYRRAIELNPRFAEAQFNLGNLLRDREQLAEAEGCYAVALAARPGYLKAATSLANVLALQDKQPEAEAAWRQVVALDPQSADAHFRLGSLLQSQARDRESADELQAAVYSNPRLVEAQNNLGCVLRSLGELDRAEQCFRLALAEQSDFAEALNNLGSVLHKKKDYEAAVDCFRRALALRPDFSQAHNNLGAVLLDHKQPEAALEQYRRALELDPTSSEVLINIGSALQMQGDMAAAVDYHRRALAIDPRAHRAHFSLGAAAHFAQQVNEALAHYDEAIRLKPDYAEAYYNRSFVWLSQGDFSRGWRDYEWRFHCEDYQGRRFETPRWDGSPLAGRTLLIHAEQGLGDTLHFIRYARLADRLGGPIVVEVQPALVPLLTASGYQNLLAGGSPLPTFDVHASLMSMPGLLATTVDTVPANVPYLSTDPELVARWRERLAETPGFKIGIVWQGNPAYTFDRFRSIPLAEFSPLAVVPGVELLSLQKNAGIEQIAALERRFRVCDLGSTLDLTVGPFLEMAAVMANLDLLITSDTAAAHLAGGLGVPVWLALGKACEWRWMNDRSDSPWYPTMRLFRQSRHGDWSDVFRAMQREVTELVRHRPPGS